MNNPIILQQHNKREAHRHECDKNMILFNMQSFTDTAIAAIPPDLMTLDTWLKSKSDPAGKALSPKQIACETSNYLTTMIWKEDMPGTDAEGFVTFTTRYDYPPGKGDWQYKMPGTSVPVMQHNIKTGWGNGLSTPPTASQLNNRCKATQLMINNYRSEVLSSTDERKKFLVLLATIGHADPLWLCRKYILNPNTLEGIHRHPIDPPKAIFTPYTEVTHPVTQSSPGESLPEPDPLPSESDQPTTPTTPITDNRLPITIFTYSPRAIVVIGPTKAFRDQFKALWGRWSVNLRHPVTGQPLKGWVFSSKRKTQIEKLISIAA